MTRWTLLALTTGLTVLLGAAAAAADDSLSAARELYAAAEYEDALAVLNRLQAGDASTPDLPAIEQYRAYCLLALGKTADAEQAIEAVVMAQPLYHPQDGDVSPRVRSAFSDVRRRMLPSIIQERYATAKANFDAKNFVLASQGFAEILDALADPDVAPLAGRPPLSDLRMLSAGFRDLSAAATPPPPVIAVAEPAPPLPAPARLRVYSTADAGAAPPTVIHQTLPTFPAQLVAASPGTLELVIDENGGVESARMRGSVSPWYDTLLLEATRNWKYKPATVDGVPVKFRKLIQISVKR